MAELERSTLLSNNGNTSADETEDNQGKYRDVRKLERCLGRAGYGFFHVLLLLVSGLATAADAVEIFGVSFVLPIADSDLDLSSADKGWLDAIIFVGMMIGGYMWGSLADVIGRRICLISAMLVNGVSGFISAFSPNFAFFLVFRFASGIGVGGSQPVVFSYVSEFFTEKQRGPMVVILASCWQPGIIFAALLAWILLGIPGVNSSISFYLGSLHIVNWRIYLMIITIPSLVSSASFMCMPETPAFLYHKSRKTDLEKTLKKIHKINSYCPCCWRIGQDEEQSSLIEEESIVLEASQSTGTDDEWEGSESHPRRYTAQHCLSSITTKVKKVIEGTIEIFRWNYLRATLLLLIIWFTQSYGYYGLQLWFPEYFKRLEYNCTGPIDGCNSSDLQFYRDTLYVALASLPGNIVGTILINIIGARVQLAGAMILSALSVFSIWKVPSRHGIVLGMSCIFGAVTVTVFSALDVCVMNIYETAIRSTAFGVHSGIGRVGAILGNVTFGHLIDADVSLPILLVASCLAVGAVAAIFLPPVYRPENRPPLQRALVHLASKCPRRSKRTDDFSANYYGANGKKERDVTTCETVAL